MALLRSGLTSLSCTRDVIVKCLNARLSGCRKKFAGTLAISKISLIRNMRKTNGLMRSFLCSSCFSSCIKTSLSLPCPPEKDCLHSGVLRNRNEITHSTCHLLSSPGKNLILFYGFFLWLLLSRTVFLPLIWVESMKRWLYFERMHVGPKYTYVYISIKISFAYAFVRQFRESNWEWRRWVVGI